MVVLVRNSPILPIPLDVGWVIPATAILDQLMLAAAGLLVGTYEKNSPLHLGGGVSELVSDGVGFTVTTTLAGIGFVHPEIDI